jgi:hypothetical protein
LDPYDLIDLSKASEKKDRIVKSKTCLKKKEAFGIMGTIRKDNKTAEVASDFECKYTFDTPQVGANNYKDVSKTYEGITAKFTSDQDCDVKKKYTIWFNVTCNPDKEFKGDFGKAKAVTECSRTYTAEGKEGCNTMNLAPFYKYMMVFGAIEFIAGLVVCFYGIKIYDKLIFMFAFMATAAVVLGISFSFYTTSATPLIIGGILAIICGLGVAYVFRSFIMDHGVALLGLVCGGILGMMVGAPITNSIVKMVIMAVCGGAGAFVGYKYNEFIKVLGMAIIGSGMIVHGLGQYIPGFPPMTIPDPDAAKDLINA